MARGKAARREVPRSSHAGFTPGTHRPDPVALLEQQAVTRVPELVPIRYGRMLVSPFTFYRGAALIMAADLAGTPRSGITTQVCGDAHLMNFGVFASPERRLEFGINDFDETYPGPWEWDVKRLAASFAIAGRDNGFSTKERTKVLLALLGEYRSAMHEFAAMTNLAVWYSHIDVEATVTAAAAPGRPGRAQAGRGQRGQGSHPRQHAGLRQAHPRRGRAAAHHQRPAARPADRGALRGDGARPDPRVRCGRVIRSYRRTLQSDRRHLLEDFRLADVARKVVGVGSVGTRAWIVLMLGRDDTDPLFLQAKEAEASVLEEFVGRSDRRSHGERVVHGQHLMQASSDIFLGWDHVHGCRRRRARLLRPSTPRLEGRRAGRDHDTPPPWPSTPASVPTTLARAHARSGDRIAIASYLGGSDAFDRAIAEFSEAYADQNERDYDALVQAEKRRPHHRPARPLTQLRNRLFGA